MDTRACVPCIIAASGHMDMKGRHPGAAKGEHRQNRSDNERRRRKSQRKRQRKREFLSECDAWLWNKAKPTSGSKVRSSRTLEACDEWLWGSATSASKGRKKSRTASTRDSGTKELPIVIFDSSDEDDGLLESMRCEMEAVRKSTSNDQNMPSDSTNEKVLDVRTALESESQPPKDQKSNEKTSVTGLSKDSGVATPHLELNRKALQLADPTTMAWWARSRGMSLAGCEKLRTRALWGREAVPMSFNDWLSHGLNTADARLAHEGIQMILKTA